MERPIGIREIAIGAVCAILGLLGGILIDLPEDDPSSRTYQDEVAAEQASGDVAEEATTAPEVVPTKDDFSMAVRTKGEECFGSAGCILTIGLVPEFTGAPVGDGAWDITYRLEGVSDGRSVDTFTLDDDELTWDDQVSVQTKGPGATIRAEITAVERNY